MTKGTDIDRLTVTFAGAATAGTKHLGTRRTAAAVATAAAALLLLQGCARNESRAAGAPGAELLAGIQLAEHVFPEVGTFHLPEGWHVTQGEYPSQYGAQHYHMVRARRDRDDEDRGLLSVDISPSHPRLWRGPLSAHVRSRLRTLATLGETTDIQTAAGTPELHYDAEQRVVDVAGELRTVFRVFRQRSRVVTVAFTAAVAHFDEELGADLVERVSESLLIHLPVVRYDKPDLTRTRERTLGGVLAAQIPVGWRLIRHREDASLVPAVTFELTPPDPDMADHPPTLSLAVVRLSLLGPDVEVEAVAAAESGTEVRMQHHAGASVFQIDDDTIGAARVAKVGGDVLTITYAAPDYLFEVKPALDLLERVARSVSLTALP